MKLINEKETTLSDYFKELKEERFAERSARDAKSSRIAAWVSAIAAIVAAIAAVITVFK